jgi:hypothetical protein
MLKPIVHPKKQNYMNLDGHQSIQENARTSWNGFSSEDFCKFAMNTYVHPSAKVAIASFVSKKHDDWLISNSPILKACYNGMKNREKKIGKIKQIRLSRSDQIIKKGKKKTMTLKDHMKKLKDD